MNSSFFIELVDKYFGKLIGKITEKYNDKDNKQTYLHKSILTTEYSANLQWGSSELNHSIVAADVVSTNSSLPLKKRSTLNKATGKLPKVGLKFYKDEDDIDELNTMLAKGTEEATVASKLMDDASKAVEGIDVRNEIMLLQALSSGVAETDDTNNTGTAIRVDFGYLTANEFNATTAAWSQSNATPLDDIDQLFTKAGQDGNTIGHVWIGLKYFNYLRKSTQGKLLVANFMGHVVTSANTLSTPSKAQMLEALRDEYAAEFHVVNFTARIEKTDGTYSNVTPWEEGAIVGTPSDKVGRLVYGTLAEETNPVQGVSYVKSGNYTLVSKYSENDPIKEFTAAQARCIPVIDNVSSIYKLDASATA